MNRTNTLVIGIGSSNGDDRIGWMIADRLATEIKSDEVAVRHAKTPVDLLDWFDEIEHVILCDACTGLGTPGTVRHFVWPADEIQAASFSNTHGMSVPSVLQLAQRLDKLPARIDIWAIEKSNAASSETIAARLLQSVDHVVCEVVDRLQQPTYS